MGLLFENKQAKTKTEAGYPPRRRFTALRNKQDLQGSCARSWAIVHSAWKL